jgi:hypothetical protein
MLMPHYQNSTFLKPFRAAAIRGISWLFLVSSLNAPLSAMEIFPPGFGKPATSQPANKTTNKTVKPTATESAATKNDAANFSFALIGDLPYFNELNETNALISDINKDSGVQFVMHAGDIKSGNAPCTDEIIEQRFALFSQFTRPFILTPGDNEWTDCFRSGFNPVDRLGFLRQIFFGPDNQDLNTLQTVSQSSIQAGFEDYTENRLFLRNGVLFATVHIVGSNNSLNPWKEFDPADSWGRPNKQRIGEFKARQKANLAWLDFVFAEAKRLEVKGLFLLSQANPQFNKLGSGNASMEGFEAVLARVKTLTGELTIPTVYAHGDFHRLIVDQPWPDRPHVTRVQTYGSPWIHWIKVNVSPEQSAVFEFEQQLMLKRNKR